ncbi:hypothetical protein Tco_0332029 [Tanacetum coccineum]
MTGRVGGIIDRHCSRQVGEIGPSAGTMVGDSQTKCSYLLLLVPPSSSSSTHPPSLASSPEEVRGKAVPQPGIIMVSPQKGNLLGILGSGRSQGHAPAGTERGGLLAVAESVDPSTMTRGMSPIRYFPSSLTLPERFLVGYGQLSLVEIELDVILKNGKIVSTIELTDKGVTTKASFDYIIWFS